MKMKRNVAYVILSALILGSGLTASKLHTPKETMVAKAAGFETFNANIALGARMSYGAGTTTDFDWVNCVMMNQASTGSGIYIRMRNYTGVKTPITAQIADGDGALWAVGIANLKYYTYSRLGEFEKECTYLYTTNIELDPYFDGFVYLPYSNYTVDVWGLGKPSMNTSKIWKVMFGLQPIYNGYANYTIGDAFSAGGLMLNCETIVDDQFGTVFFTTEKYSDGTITATRELATEFRADDKNLLGGTVIKTHTAATSIGVVADLVTAERGIFGYGFYMRVQNQTGDIWPMLQVMGCDGDNCLPKAGAPIYYYEADGTYLTLHDASAYNTLFIPSGFDGFIYVPLSSLYNANPSAPVRFDWLYGIFMTIDALAFPNRVLNIGDIFAATGPLLRDTSASTHTVFAGYRNNANGVGQLCHYPGFVDDGATEWAEAFLLATTPCDTAAGTVWADYETEFINLSADDQALLVDAVYTGLTDEKKTSVQQAMQRYDLAVQRQSLDNYMARALLPVSTQTMRPSMDDNQQMLMIIVIAFALLAGGYLFIHKKRRA
ncbi:MAG: hypothetical protein ACOX6L_12455 [Syntrophomonadaceae bacterium]|jgi:hypothetical protein